MLINSAFDPDSTGTGHQPLYYDTYSSVYDQYAVISAKIKVTFLSNATTSGMIFGGVVDDDTSSSSTYQTLCEQTTSTHMMLSNATGSDSRRTITINWNAKDHLGIDPYASETYKTAVGVNPTETSTLIIFAKPADGSSTTTSLVFVDLEQTILFTELSTPVQS
jgi:hypothetical protein